MSIADKKWKPGDVAMVRLDHETEIRVMFTSSGWRGVKGAFYDLNLSARPLVVIDPEDREQVERLTTEYVKTWLGPREATSPESVEQMQAALREFANPTPPIEEPTGLGAVVEDDEGQRWLMTNPRGVAKWSPKNAGADAKVGYFREWPEIAVVRVLSEGVVPA